MTAGLLRTIERALGTWIGHLAGEAFSVQALFAAFGRAATLLAPRRAAEIPLHFVIACWAAVPVSSEHPTGGQSAGLISAFAVVAAARALDASARSLLSSRCRKGTHWPPQCARNRSIRPSRRPCQAVSVGERSTQHGRYEPESCRHTHLLRPSRKIESVRLLRPTHSPSARARCACRLSPVRVACRDDGDDRRAERRARSAPTSLSAYVGRCASCDVARSCDLCIAKLRCMGLPRWRVLADRCLPVCVDACGQEPDGWCGKRSWERERGESGPVPSRALTPAPRPARCRLWSGGRRRTPDRQAALVLGLGLGSGRRSPQVGLAARAQPPGLYCLSR